MGFSSKNNLEHNALKVIDFESHALETLFLEVIPMSFDPTLKVSIERRKKFHISFDSIKQAIARRPSLEGVVTPNK